MGTVGQRFECFAGFSANAHAEAILIDLHRPTAPHEATSLTTNSGSDGIDV